LATPAFFFSLTMKYSCLPDHPSRGNINRVSTYLAVQIHRTTSLTPNTPPLFCRQFDVCVSASHSNGVFLYEVYDSKAAFDAHLASAHFRQFTESTAA